MNQLIPPATSRPRRQWRWLLPAAGIALLAGAPAPAADGELTHLRDDRGTLLAIVNPAAKRGPVAGGKSGGIASEEATAPTRKFCSPTTGPDPAECARAFLAAQAGSFGIRDPERELADGSVTTDDLGMTHLFHPQMHRGVPVYGAALVSHVNHRGEVVSLNGRTLPDVATDTTPAISPSDAIRIARAATGREADFSAPRLPALQLFNKAFLGLGAAEEDRVTRLVWEVSLSGPMDSGPAYFINAQDGSVVHADSGEHHATTRQIYDCALIDTSAPGCRLDVLKLLNSGEYYILGRSEGQPARGPMPGGAGPPYAGSTDVDDAYNFHLPLLHQFMADRFDRDGANDRGGTGNGTSVPFGVSRFWVHGNGEPSTGVHVCNPYYAWAGTVSVVVCANMLSNPALDINDLLLHEYGHLVNRYRSFQANGTANSLLLSGLAGALNENMADIFGVSFEKYRTGTYDWEMFQGASIGSGYVRSLSNPPTGSSDVPGGIPAPDRYYSPGFYCGSFDSGGIHHNSTVPGKAAYLASEGGTFNGCTIQPLGVDKVVNIWYRALIHYHAPAETFNGAYGNFIQACRDLYSEADCAELTKALQAVEMDQPGACSGVPARPATCAPVPQLTMDTTPAGLRWRWGSEAAGWTLQCSTDLVTFTNLAVLTGSGEHLEPAGDTRKYCRLQWLP